MSRALMSDLGTRAARLPVAARSWKVDPGSVSLTRIGLVPRCPRVARSRRTAWHCDSSSRRRQNSAAEHAARPYMLPQVRGATPGHWRLRPRAYAMTSERDRPPPTTRLPRTMRAAARSSILGHPMNTPLTRARAHEKEAQRRLLDTGSTCWLRIVLRPSVRFRSCGWWCRGSYHHLCTAEPLPARGY